MPYRKLDTNETTHQGSKSKTVLSDGSDVVCQLLALTVFLSDQGVKVSDWSWRLVTTFHCLVWLRLVETLRTSSSEYEDYEFDDLAATVKLYEPSLAFSFDNL